MKKYIVIFFILGIFIGLFAKDGKILPSKEVQKQDNKKQFPRMRKIHWGWRYFSTLTDEERAKLLQVQRQDPEQFRKILFEKGQLLKQKEFAAFEELKNKVALWKKTTNKVEKEKIKAEITLQLKKDFFKRLAENRRHNEELKKRVLKMELELKKREEKANDIIKAQVEGILNGRIGLIKPGTRPSRRPPVGPPPNANLGGK
jgi:hypothetical protein